MFSRYWIRPRQQTLTSGCHHDNVVATCPTGVFVGPPCLSSCSLPVLHGYTALQMYGQVEGSGFGSHAILPAPALQYKVCSIGSETLQVQLASHGCGDGALAREAATALEDARAEGA